MNWHGWWTIFLPLYIILAAIMDWLFTEYGIDQIFNSITHLIFQLLIILILVIISLLAYKMIGEWTKTVIITLLSFDLLFIVNSAFLFQIYVFT